MAQQFEGRTSCVM